MAPYRWMDCPPQAPQASPFGALPVHLACVDYADPGQRSSSASSWDRRHELCTSVCHPGSYGVPEVGTHANQSASTINGSEKEITQSETTPPLPE